MKTSTIFHTALWLLFFLYFPAGSIAQSDSCAVFTPFTFGVIADCQCGSTTCNSIPKLQDAIDFYNDNTNIEFCAHLGDFIMSSGDGIPNYNMVQPIYESLNAPHYYALGNHEWDIPDAMKPGLKDMLGMPDYYYDFKVENFRFIFIESGELAFYNEPAHPELVSERDAMYAALGGSTSSGGISQSQLAYIDATIAMAEQNDENVVLFAHHPIYPPASANVWNDTELITILESHTNVVAYMNGHKHAGDYAVNNGIHYLTHKAMLTHTNSFSVVEVVEDTLKVRGQFDADDFDLTFVAKIKSLDADGDGYCDDDDLCLNFDDALIGTSCDDLDGCTENDVYDSVCNCLGSLIDINMNGICDSIEVCPSLSGPIVLTSAGPSSLTVSWASPAGVIGYELEYKAVSDLTWTSTQTIIPFAFISGLSSCTDYEFRARPTCAVGQAATFSPIATFSTTDCFVCTAPVGLFQFNIQNISAIITWDVLVGATDYSYRFRPVGSTAWISQTTTFPIAVLFGVSGCTDYEWTIDVTCYDGSTASSSSLSTFSTVCKDEIELPLEDELKSKAWPNPSSEFLQLSGFDKADIKIYTLNGENVFEMRDYIQNEFIDTKHLKSGIYFVEIETQYSSRTMSIVIE